jgi:hypothetical protein
MGMKKWVELTKELGKASPLFGGVFVYLDFLENRDDRKSFRVIMN